MVSRESKGEKKTLGTKIQSMIQGEPLDAQNSPSGKAEAERVREGEGRRRSNFVLIWSKVLQALLGARTPGSPGNLAFRSRCLRPKMRKPTPGGFLGKLKKF